MAYKKAAPAYSTASAGVQLTLTEDNVCAEVRLVLGSAGPTAVTCSAAEEALKGQVVDEGKLARAADAIVAASAPTADTRGSAEFKRMILKTLIGQAYQRAVRRAKGEQVAGGHNYV